MYDGHWFGGGFMWLVLIFFVVLFLWMTKSFNNNNNEKQQSAIDILKERYAKGEINREEYSAKKRDLNG
ncbi:MAG TPA: SHOCT domain-containing protein [Thiothrix sp.]|nr:SHOCT domain-containing protein [Thiothrix sp.]